MTQRFKSIYYADYPSSAAASRHLSVAFGKDDMDVFDFAKSRSGHELREMIGHRSYDSLRASADHEQMSVNAFCVRALREQLALDLRSGTDGPQEASADSDWLSSVQATFRGGELEPLHNWYPYPEGYSPRYVEGIIQDYAQQAESVLDPFGGIGTTVLVASRLRRRAYFAEVNPVLQYISSAKVQVLTMTALERLATSYEIERFGTELEDHLEHTNPSNALSAAYSNVFANSVFYGTADFDAILRCRSVLDDLAFRSPLTATLATVAVLGSLIPSSYLVRAGDLRYRTGGAYGTPTGEFVRYVRERISLIVADLRRLGPLRLRKTPLLVAEDARTLAHLPSLQVDAIITSPPYLNGTNYIRNSKVELWFLGLLGTKKDLAGYRTRVVTAGINDVSARRRLRAVHGAVEAIVRELSANAYDARIPLMVHGYVQDMADVLDGFAHHLSEKGTVAIDIGDSAYGGVHVPTDRIISSLLDERGFDLTEDVTLRRRLSRGGMVLRQALLIFRRRGWHVSTNPPPPALPIAWERFKETLPHQAPPFNKRNWGHPLHSLCSFQGKMKPALASELVNCFVPSGGTMLDPFAGVATIPFEAALSGRVGIGFDISPAAWVIGMAKLGSPDGDACQRILDEIKEAIEGTVLSDDEVAAGAKFGMNGAIAEYFHPRTLREILAARAYFLNRFPTDASEALVMASLMHILHGNRPYALSRRSHPITPFAPSGGFEYRPLLPRLTEKVRKSLMSGRDEPFKAGEMLFQDGTSWWPQHVANLDAIITSPPFFDSTRFYSANWMRLWFAGWTGPDFKYKPSAFVDERQKHGFDVYTSIFRQAKERLKTGGVLVLHLGKSRKCDMADALSTIAAPWFRVADRFDESVAHCESHGIRDKGTVEHHQFLVLV